MVCFRHVDEEILKILRNRKSHCLLYERDDWAKNCGEMIEDFHQAFTNFFIRYGEMGHFSTSINALMKQKHRMIWERRNPDKVDFMYAKERQELGKYGIPVEKGALNTAQYPDNSRSRWQTMKEL